MRYLIEFVVSILSSIGFGLVFSMPKRALLVSGINGGIGWIIYKLVLNTTSSIYVASFLSALVISSISEIQARKFKFPASIFIIPGVINLCPGEAIYNTMRFFINNQSQNAIASFYKSIAIAGALAFGVLLASSLSTSMKKFRIRGTKRTDYLKETWWLKKYI